MRSALIRVILPVLWLTAMSASSGAADLPRETRVHWSMLDSIERLPAEKQRELRSAAEIPQITIIRRSEFPLITKANPPAAGEAIRRSTIVLVDPASKGIRFSWTENRDFEKGRAEYALVVYYPTRVRDEVRLSVEYPILGRDFDSYFAAAGEARRKGFLASDGQLLVTIDYSGRKWMLTVEEWRRGLFSSEDKKWLSGAVEGRLKAALNLVLSVGFGLPELQMACDLVVLPMLGDYERTFKSADKLIRPRGKPDCDFDAWFGQPCSLKDQMEFTLRKEAQLSPPAP